MYAWIKLVAIYILRILMRLLYFFPVQKGRFIFNSYRGSQYSCNPKYISEYLETLDNQNIELVWAVKAPEKFYFLKERGIKVVRYASLKRFYYEATAQGSINNVGSFSWLPLRKGQYHINTWHGGGCYKNVGMSEQTSSDVYKKTLRMTVNETTHFVSGSRFSSEVVIPKDFDYHGKLLEYGLPRNDFLVNGEWKNVRGRVCRDLGLEEHLFLVLYAPTWRYDMDEKISVPDFAKLKKAVKERFRTECVILFRAHPNLHSPVSGDFKDVTLYSDMQELLAAADMLISDYSSCIWDYSFTYRPCMLYVPDLNKYKSERGFVEDIYKWGFPVCVNDRELMKAILQYDEESNKTALQRHQKELGSLESGHSAEKIAGLLIGEEPV